MHRAPHPIVVTARVKVVAVVAVRVHKALVAAAATATPKKRSHSHHVCPSPAQSLLLFLAHWVPHVHHPVPNLIKRLAHWVPHMGRRHHPVPSLPQCLAPFLVTPLPLVATEWWMYYCNQLAKAALLHQLNDPKNFGAVLMHPSRSPSRSQSHHQNISI